MGLHLDAWLVHAYVVVPPKLSGLGILHGSDSLRPYHADPSRYVQENNTVVATSAPISVDAVVDSTPP